MDTQETAQEMLNRASNRGRITQIDQSIEHPNCRSFQVRGEYHLKEGGENMKKLYQAVILNKDLGKVEGTQWVTAEDKEQAFAKVNLTEHSVESVKVFLNKVGEYK